MISWWQVAGAEPESRAAAATKSPAPPAIEPQLDVDEEVRKLAVAAAGLPPAEGNYTETDFITNLLATVLDYQMQTPVVERAIVHYKTNRWDEIRTLDDLEGRFRSRL